MPPARVEFLQGTLDMLILRTLTLGPLHGYGISRALRQTTGDAIQVEAGSLDEALSCLEDDHAFLLRGDVFTEELIETFIDYKRKNEAEAVRLRPHPYEFALYYDI